MQSKPITIPQRRQSRIKDRIITEIANGAELEELFYKFGSIVTRDKVIEVWRECFPLAPTQWCAAEEEILSKHFYRMGSPYVQVELSKAGFSRSIDAIEIQAGIMRRAGRLGYSKWFWTDEERKIVAEYYKREGTKAVKDRIEEMTGVRRTESSVKNQYYYLKNFENNKANIL